MYLCAAIGDGSTGLNAGVRPGFGQAFFNLYEEDEAFAPAGGVRDPGIVEYEGGLLLCAPDYSGTGDLHVWFSESVWPISWNHVVDLPLGPTWAVHGGGCCSWIVARGQIYAVPMAGNGWPVVCVPPAAFADWGNAGRWSVHEPYASTVLTYDDIYYNMYWQYDPVSDLFFAFGPNGPPLWMVSDDLLDMSAARFGVSPDGSGFQGGDNEGAQVVLLSDGSFRQYYFAQDDNASPVGVSYYQDWVDWRDGFADCGDFAGGDWGPTVEGAQAGGVVTLDFRTAAGFAGNVAGLPCWLSGTRLSVDGSKRILDQFGVPY